MGELFEYFLIVSLDENYEPEIIFRFPDKITEKVVTQVIPRFCFPDVDEIKMQIENIPAHKDRVVESFSFTSTVSDGGKRWGYCRRFLYRDKSMRPTCFCLLSFCASFSLFSQMLDIVELKLEEGHKAVFAFLHSVLAQPFPDPGETVVAKTISFAKNEKGEEDYKPEVFRLTRSDNDYEYLEYTTFEPLFKLLDVDKILYIFECLLLERRILVVAKTLGELSACVDAISNMAYPFSWQYVFIPILPKSMLSFLGAPMPFLMGILSTALPLIDKEPIEEEVLIVDLDNNTFLREPERVDFMPTSLLGSLERNLKKIVKSGKTGMEFNLLVAHAFLRFLSAIFHDYAKYISTDTYTFDLNKFLKHKSTEIRKFMSVFQEVQMYNTFIQEREAMAAKDSLGWCIFQRISGTDLKKKISETVNPDRLRPAKYVREVLQALRIPGQGQASDTIVRSNSNDKVNADNSSESADAKPDAKQDTKLDVTPHSGSSATSFFSQSGKTVLTAFKAIKSRLGGKEDKELRDKKDKKDKRVKTKDTPDEQKTGKDADDASKRATTSSDSSCISDSTPKSDSALKKSKKNKSEGDSHTTSEDDSSGDVSSSAAPIIPPGTVKAMVAERNAMISQSPSQPPARPPRPTLHKTAPAILEKTDKPVRRGPAHSVSHSTRAHVKSEEPKVPPKPKSKRMQWPPPDSNEGKDATSVPRRKMTVATTASKPDESSQ